MTIKNLFISFRSRMMTLAAKKNSWDFVLAGLGNPGSTYQKTRHNLGFLVADSLAPEKFGRKKFSSFWLPAELEEKKVVLLKPQTFMNRSGESVARWLQFLKLPASSLIVIHDDLDLPLGKIRIKNRGGAGGHRGVESVIAALGTQDFIRVRVGIGRPAVEMEEADYVLSEFTRAEKREVSRIVETARDAVLTILESGIDKAQLKFHSL